MKKGTYMGRGFTTCEKVLPNILFLHFHFVVAYRVGCKYGWSFVCLDDTQSIDAFREHFEQENESDELLGIVFTSVHRKLFHRVSLLAEKWEIPIFMHTLAKGGGMPSQPRVFSLPDNGDIPCMPGWCWVHTPENHQGEISFFRKWDRTLIVAENEAHKIDLLLDSDKEESEAHFPIQWQLSQEALSQLAALRPSSVVTNGSKRIGQGEAVEKIAFLQRHFHEIAIQN